MNWKNTLCFLFSLASLLACTTPKSDGYGVQPNQLARIPALSAILPCRLWPQNALFDKVAPTTVAPGDITAVCAAFDKFILESFSDQPYMRGLSPSVVQQLLKKKQVEATLGELDAFWGGTQNLCKSCANAATYYNKGLAPNPAWRQWLNTFSRNSADADSLLLPYVLEAKTGVINDRGLYYAGRSASLVLLLVDSNNGDLIWAGTKQAESRSPLSGKPDDPAKVPLPGWEEVFKRLFQAELWLDFPGRQN